MALVQIYMVLAYIYIALDQSKMKKNYTPVKNLFSDFHWTQQKTEIQMVPFCKFFQI